MSDLIDRQGSDLIDRQAAIDEINSYEDDVPEYMEGWVRKLIDAVKGDIRGLISELPSATPEIVSCEDCRHWVTVVDREKAEYGLCSCLKVPIGTTPRDGYCYRAERRSENER